MYIYKSNISTISWFKWLKMKNNKTKESKQSIQFFISTKILIVDTGKQEKKSYLSNTTNKQEHSHLQEKRGKLGAHFCSFLFFTFLKFRFRFVESKSEPIVYLKLQFRNICPFRWMALTFVTTARPRCQMSQN